MRLEKTGYYIDKSWTNCSLSIYHSKFDIGPWSTISVLIKVAGFLPLQSEGLLCAKRMPKHMQYENVLLKYCAFAQSDVEAIKQGKPMHRNNTPAYAPS